MNFEAKHEQKYIADSLKIVKELVSLAIYLRSQQKLIRNEIKDMKNLKYLVEPLKKAIHVAVDLSVDRFLSQLQSFILPFYVTHYVL